MDSSLDISSGKFLDQSGETDTHKEIGLKLDRTPNPKTKWHYESPHVGKYEFHESKNGLVHLKPENSNRKVCFGLNPKDLSSLKSKSMDNISNTSQSVAKKDLIGEVSILERRISILKNSEAQPVNPGNMNLLQSFES